MYNKTDRGGIGIYNVKCKSTALLLTHVKDIINCVGKTWFPFARYWLGFRLRGENRDLDSNSLPRAETMPPFYQKCLTAFSIIKGEYPNLDWKKERSKTFYTKLLEIELDKPHVEIKRPLRDYEPTWKLIKNAHCTNKVKDMHWKLVHEILPTGDFLYTHHITRDVRQRHCRFCTGIEDSDHLYYRCAISDQLWMFIQIILNGCPDKVPITLNNVLLKEHWRACTGCTTLVLEGNYTLWLCRNEAKFQDFKFTSEQIVYRYRNRIKLFMKADYWQGLNHFKRFWPTNERLYRLSTDNDLLFQI
jgi:hypothetical protein